MSLGGKTLGANVRLFILCAVIAIIAWSVVAIRRKRKGGSILAMKICDNESCRAFGPTDKMHKVVRNDGKKCYLCARCFKMMKEAQAEEIRKKRRTERGLIIPQGQPTLDPLTKNPKFN